MGLQDENRESFDAALAKANALERKKKEKSPAPVDIYDPAALRKLTKSVLVEILQTYAKTPALVPVCKELMDRVDGKAKESIEISGNVEHEHRVLLPATKAWRESMLKARVIDNNTHVDIE
jgi:hypothetical protein